MCCVSVYVKCVCVNVCVSVCLSVCLILCVVVFVHVGVCLMQRCMTQPPTVEYSMMEYEDVPVFYLAEVYCPLRFIVDVHTQTHTDRHTHSDRHTHTQIHHTCTLTSKSENVVLGHGKMSSFFGLIQKRKISSKTVGYVLFIV